MGDSRVPPKKVSIHRRRWVRIAIVVIGLFVVARIFAFDIRQIPSNSMLPTLRGDEKTGDRVFVDLLTPLFRAPERFEVVAFHDPQQKGRDLVKRVGGLPGETVLLRDGDININGKLYRKNAEERRRVRVPIFRESKHANGIKDGFDITEFKNLSEFDPAHWLHSRLESQSAGILYKSTIIPSDGFENDDGSYARRPGELPVFDLQFEIPIRLDPIYAKFLLCLQHGGDEFIFVLSSNDSTPDLDLSVERRSIVKSREDNQGTLLSTIIYKGTLTRARAGQTARLSFSNIDCRISVEVNGEEFKIPGSLPFDYDTHTPYLPIGGAAKRLRSGIEFVFVKSTFGAAGEVNIYRDVVYEPRGEHGCKNEYLLAKNQYFLLGDYSSDSTDSRVFGAVSGDDWIGYLRAIVSPWSRARFIK
ncbi:MAG: signal peptidase I [Planctomycetota bacterium]